VKESNSIARRGGSLVRRAQTAIEQRVQIKEESEVLQPSRFWLRATAWGLMGTTLFGVAWLSLAQTEEIVVANGKLEPEGEVKDIQVPVGGVVEQILVKEGEQVKAGQVLLRLDSETTADRQQSLRDTIALKQQQLALKLEEEARYLELNSTEQGVLRRNLILQQDIANRFQKLESEGAGSELQLLQQSDKVQQVVGELEKTQVERQRQAAQLGQQIQQLRGELSQLNSQLTEQTVNLRYQVIRSPVSGIIFELKPKAKGFVAQGSEPLMKVVPFNQLEAKVEIPSSDIGFVQIGQKADISIDSFPATDFGVLEGTVKRVGSDALPPDQAKGRTEYRFPASITLSSQQLKLKSGRKLPLQVGMSLNANIKLRKVSYLQLLLGGFKDKADSLRRI
jgi:HlyD family secretion protein